MTGFRVRIVGTALATVLFCTSGWAQDLKHTTETIPEIKRAIEEKKGVLIDVRSQAEWDKGHIAGAVFLPITDLQKGVTKQDLAKKIPQDKIVYCHCAVGVRALSAAKLLKELGYEVRAVKPGYAQLVEGGFPKAPPAESPPATPAAAK